MDFNYQTKDQQSKYTGAAVVVGLHVLIAYALVSGLARKAVEVVKKPLEAVVIQEVKLPPPPPPPPKPIRPIERTVPKIQAPPPPPYIPPPLVQPPPAPAPVVVPSIQTPPPAPPVIAPPPPPAPPAPPAAPAGPVQAGVVCPTRTEPEYPRKARQESIEGLVKVTAVVQGGQLKDVTFVSGPRVFQAAVRAALAQYACTAPDGQTVNAEFNFKLE